MALDITTMKCDINAEPQEILRFKQYDNLSRIIILELTDEGAPIELDGCDAVLYVKKSDGTQVFQSCEILDASYGQLKIALKQQTLACAGEALCEVVITGNNKVLTTRTFKIDVLPCIRDEKAIESSDDFTDLQQMLSGYVTVNKIIAIFNSAYQAYIQSGGDSAFEEWLATLGAGSSSGSGSGETIHIRYADSASPASWDDMYASPLGHSYIGIYTGTALSPPVSPGLYSWAKYKGDDGSDGITPIKGKDYWTTDDMQEIREYVDTVMSDKKGLLEPSAYAIPSTAAEYHALWDKFVADGFATRTLLGTVNNEPIYEYDFLMCKSWAEGDDVHINKEGFLYNKPKAAFVSGLHGNERATPVLLYELMYRLCYTHDYIGLLSKYDFYVIPLVNSNGFTSNTRENGDGIDINRDSENIATVEAGILKSFIDRHYYSIFIDFHMTLLGSSSSPDINSYITYAWDSTQEKIDQISNAFMKAGIETDIAMSRFVNKPFRQTCYPWSGSSNPTWRNYAADHAYLSVCFETTMKAYYYSQSDVLYNTIQMLFSNTLLIKTVNNLLSIDVPLDRIGNNEDGLPSEYRRVEYISTDGNQYIDTGILASDYETDIDYYMSGRVKSFLNNSGNNNFFGCILNNCRSGNFAVSTLTNYMTFALGGTADLAYLTDNNIVAGNDFVISIKNANTHEPNKATVLANGATLYKPASDIVASDMPNGNIYLFHNNGSSNAKFCGECTSFKMDKSDGTPIINLVPCYRISDNVVGMYDTVGGNFHENNGTGVFGKGNDVF